MCFIPGVAEVSIGSPVPSLKEIMVNLKDNRGLVIVIPEVGRLSQEDCGFKNSLHYVIFSCQTWKNGVVVMRSIEKASAS